MPRALLTMRLGIVDEQLGLVQANIHAQQTLIEGMRKKGFATGDAETQLTILHASLASDLAERERLSAQLAALPPH